MTSPTAPHPCWGDVASAALTTCPRPPSGSTGLLVVLLDDEHRVTGRTLVRAVDPALGAADREMLLAEAVHVLRNGHSAGESASQCLLVCTGPAAPSAVPTWRSALLRSCAATDLRPVDVVAVEDPAAGTLAPPGLPSSSGTTPGGPLAGLPG